jgi:2-polyprenyl-3-methyl-5-hydroxy-6-metoxy-1,4-benzoquinol methylase
MSSAATDKAWETLGRVDPYWAVISNDAYHGRRLTDQQLAAFLKSGADHVDDIWRSCRRVFGDDFAPRRVLDFGCGVGRVTLPLARRVDAVVAIDIADSMLAVARELLERHGVTNVELVRSDATLSAIHGPFDLVHSVIVLQHIPPAPGLRLVSRLVELAGDAGVVVLHVLYHNPFGRSPLARLAHRLLAPLRDRYRRVPEIQMNPYPLNTLFKLIQDAGVCHIHAELTNHAGHLGALLFFRKGDLG